MMLAELLGSPFKSNPADSEAHPLVLGGLPLVPKLTEVSKQTNATGLGYCLQVGPLFQ